MVDKIKGFFSWIAQKFIDIYVWIIDTLLGWVEAVWNWFKGILVALWVELWALFQGLIPDEAQETLDAVDWDSVHGYLLDVAWIIPLEIMFSIIATAYAACGLIRLLRWIKSCIPTISGS